MRGVVIIQALATLVIISISAGCASPPKRTAQSPSSAFVQPCIPPPSPRHTLPVADLPEDSRRESAYLTGEPALPPQDFLSPPALRVAKILGIQELVRQIPGYEPVIASTQGKTQEADIRELKVRQQLSDRLLLASLDTANVASEIDCEVARTDRRADVLEAVEAERHRKLIVLAILGDAAVGVISGLFGLVELITAEAIASISGGSLSTTAGMTATLGKQKETELEHPRNPLREVWAPPTEPTIFPPAVWRFLNWPLSTDPSKRTRRDMLIAEWKDEGWLGEPDSKTEQKRLALFFSDGGPYTVEDLRTRARMMQVLKTHVNLLNQDIDLLLREILVANVRDRVRVPDPIPQMLKTSIAVDSLDVRMPSPSSETITVQ